MNMKNAQTMLKKLAGAGAFSLLIVQSASASLIDNGAGDARPSGTPSNLTGGSGSVFNEVANTLIYIIGAVAVIMLIIGGFRYVTSQGNEKGVTAAKDTILYSVIGIVVAIIAYAVVHFVAGAIH